MADLDLLEVEPLREALPRDLAGVGEDGLEVPLADGVDEEGDRGARTGAASRRLPPPRSW